VGLNPFRAMCIFLILARRQLYGGMRMSFALRRESERQNKE
jgi:hypothetical protein